MMSQVDIQLTMLIVIKGIEVAGKEVFWLKQRCNLGPYCISFPGARSSRHYTPIEIKGVLRAESGRIAIDSRSISNLYLSVCHAVSL